MVDALVVAQTVQRAVDAFANVAHRLFGGSHVHILDVPFQTGQRRQVLVARIAAKVLGTAAYATGAEMAANATVVAATTVAGWHHVAVVGRSRGRQMT